MLAQGEISESSELALLIIHADCQVTGENVPIEAK